MSELHPATRGFAAADVYERGRPDYPSAAVDALVERLRLGPGRTVLDLAAGTGKLTRLLVPSGADVVAVEPIPEMRAELGLHAPQATVLDGTAECIPLEDGSVDAVTVASAFHWFDADRALSELHRVLRPGEGLALIWNARDERSALQVELSGIIEPLREPGTPNRRARNWKTLLADSGLFARTERLLFSNVQPVDEQAVVDRVLSISFIAASPPSVRADVERRVRMVAAGATELPYMTELYLGFAV